MIKGNNSIRSQCLISLEVNTTRRPYDQIDLFPFILYLILDFTDHHCVTDSRAIQNNEKKKTLFPRILTTKQISMMYFLNSSLCVVYLSNLNMNSFALKFFAMYISL